MEIHVAAVCTAAEVRMLAGALAPADLERRLAAYVRRNATQLLWPTESARVLRLLEQGQSDEAISVYFSAVGDRWDQEFLHLQTLDLDAHPDELLAIADGPSRRFRQSILRDL